MTLLLHGRREEDLTKAAEAIRRGELVVLATDTCYGLACDAFNFQAVDRLKRVRAMRAETLVTVLVADMSVVEAVTSSVPPLAKALAAAFWPGPLSIMLEAQPSLQWRLGSPNDAVALRIPNHPTLTAILKESGPLAVSQASPSGQPPPYSVDDALAALGSQIDVAVESGALSRSPLSTFVDCRSGSLEILRTGPISVSEMMRVIDEVGDELSEEDTESSIRHHPTGESPEGRE